MIWMKSTDLMRKYINLFRYDKGNPLPFILVLVISTLVFSNTSLVFFRERDNLEKCVLAIKDIVTIPTQIFCTIKRLFKPEETIRVTELIEEEFLIDCYQLDISGRKWKKIKKLYDEKRKGMRSSSETVIALMHFAVLVYILRYFFTELLGATQHSRGFPTPLVSYIPPEFDQVTFPIYILVLQGFVVIVFALEVFSGYVSMVLCVQKIMTDFETFYILLDEIVIDYPDPEYSVEDDLIHVKRANQLGDGVNTEILYNDMRLIVQYHQYLNRTLNDCTRISAYGILMTSFLIAVDTCFSIYLMLQANNTKIFINYAASCIFSNLLLLLCYYSGQRISNQNEIFRRCLADLPWIDKPQWFKQSMHIMMIQANVDTEINPYGIFVLNLASYTDLMKAAFTYGNILYKRKQMG